MADALVTQLNTVSGDLAKAIEGAKLADLSKDFGNTLDSVISKLQAISRETGGGGAVFVHAFDETIIDGPLKEFVRLSTEIGGDAKTQCDIVQSAFKAQRDFLALVADCKTPPPAVFQKLLKPTSDQLGAVQQYRETNRSSKMFNHLSTVSEGIPALGWVTVPKPATYVKDMVDSAQFYSNRVLKDFKGKDEKHVDWTKSFIKLLKDLENYAATHHTAGLVWNPKGKDPASAASAAPAPPAAGGAPPPPPPGPPPPPEVAPASGGGAADDASAAKSALFADLSRGSDVTSHLKKVTPDMQTHKNPALRDQAAPTKPLSGPKPYKAPSAVSKVSAPGAKTAAAVKKPPKLELNGKKWNVEYQEGNKEMVIEAEMKHTIYVYKCNNSVLNVKGKVNSITLDNCKKTALVFENVVGTVDFINCQSVQAQVTGVAKIVSVDKTDGFQLYLSKDALECQIVTAKSSEMNISVPKDDGSGEFTEFPVPEQFKTTWNGKKLITECTESV